MAWDRSGWRGAIADLPGVLRDADHAMRSARAAIMVRDSSGPSARATRWLNLRLYRSTSAASSRYRPSVAVSRYTIGGSVGLLMAWRCCSGGYYRPPVDW